MGKWGICRFHQVGQETGIYGNYEKLGLQVFRSLSLFFCKRLNDQVAKGKCVVLRALSFKVRLFTNLFLRDENEDIIFKSKTPTLALKQNLRSLIGWDVANCRARGSKQSSRRSLSTLGWERLSWQFSYAFCFSLSFPSCSWRRSGSAMMGAVWALDGTWRKWWL